MVNSDKRDDMNESPASDDYLTFENQGHELNTRPTTTTNSSSVPPVSIPSATVNDTVITSARSKRTKAVIYISLGCLLITAIVCTLAFIIKNTSDKCSLRKHHTRETKLDGKGLDYQSLVDFINGTEVLPIPVATGCLYDNESIADFIAYSLENEKTDQISHEILYYNAFYNFATRHNKIYANYDELVKHFLVFRSNYQMIRTHNSTESTYKMEINKFGDMEYNEFICTKNDSNTGGSSLITDIVDYFKGMITPSGDNSKKIHGDSSKHGKEHGVEVKGDEFKSDKSTAFNLKFSIDYQKNGISSEVYEQNKCGDSFAYAIASAIEANYKKSSNLTLSLDAESLISSIPTSEANPIKAMEYVLKNGISKRKDESKADVPNADTKVSIKNYTKVDQNKILETLSNGPIVANISTSSHIQFYKSGVYPCLSTDGSYQTVLIVGVGYDDESKKYYWKAKNSRGKNWGNEGYIKLEVNNGTKGCKLTDAIFPIVK
ncbi:Cysteine proteinase [Babesia microti strain RI]|uniref:Cysteine proteinase n=1 Tax=Babesia microti (strain RI) TaxID=1133968 RepID=I7IPJ0_BABMR|nr:Cysteine proteinase [Babesia microti strain RI]CCF72975.1 Cysteine proteinase [Babesia microti strain RI]|eukprot:XP_012647584.1 Cysteine proteinase [Babesia microti strain RI]